MSGQVGLKDWKDQKTTDAEKELGKWLTDTDDKSTAAGRKSDQEDRLRSGLDLLKRGFKRDYLKENVTGSSLNNTLEGFMDPPFVNLTRGLFLYQPWFPRTVGDMFAFLKRFCTKIKDEENFRKEFAEKNDLDPDGLKEKSQTALDHLEGFTKKETQTEKDTSSITTSGLFPINAEIYLRLSQKHVTIYLEFLHKGIPQLKNGLKEMKGAMEKWKENAADDDQNNSRFHYGFQGGEWHKHKDGIKNAIDRLTGEDGSLNKLLVALQPRPKTAKVVGGVVSAGAAFGVGGAAYALNLSGFADILRKLFSGSLTANIMG